MGLFLNNWRAFCKKIKIRGENLKKVYCVEDDESIRNLIIYALKNNDFEVAGFEDSKSFFESLEEIPDLILLDIMLPDEDGYEILSKLKSNSKTNNIPVIMLTSKTSEFDKVKGLDMGADDYIPKPFGVMELISRINAVLRRTKTVGVNEENLSIGNIEMDIERHRVTVHGEEVHLTYKEFELLNYLMSNQGIVLSRDKIMSTVWGFDFEGESRTVDVHIRTLRIKLSDSGKLIKTIRNVGYKIGE